MQLGMALQARSIPDESFEGVVKINDFKKR